MNQEGAQACCAVCNSKTVRRCSRCLSINYCNKEHQRQDWKRHKPECIPKTAKQGSSINKNGEASTSSTDVTRIRDSLDRLVSGASSEPETREPGSATSDTRRLKKTKNKNPHKEGSVSEKKNSVNSRPNSAVLTNNSVISSVLCDNKDKVKGSAITYEGSSEQDILSETAQQLTAVDFSTGNSIHVVRPAKPEANMLAVAGYSGEQTAPMREYPEATLQGTTAPFTQPQNSFLIDPNDRWYDICQQVIRDMTQYGLCVLDNFLGKERGHLVLREVLNMYKSGIFQAGQLVSNPSSTEAQTVRSDKIAWIDGKEPYCYYINKLISQNATMSDNSPLASTVVCKSPVVDPPRLCQRFVFQFVVIRSRNDLFFDC
ncbi:hypothetical protein MSG28_007102 [Choristoneura fumiferana]|uniref:Uncharacterized protein n=1 Tax=Choristoneura fumiferana TaxID=7141 RepID=A0ACC0JMG3_CHOFU|nr:hypothetical protein MSG28_007102 [Choristoneura fumiferana]